MHIYGLMRIRNHIGYIYSLMSIYILTRIRCHIFRIYMISHVLKISHILMDFQFSDLLIFWSSDLLIFRSSDLLIFRSSDLFIFQSSDLLIFWSSDLSIFRYSDLPIFQSFDLPIFRSSDLLYGVALYGSNAAYISLYGVLCPCTTYMAFCIWYLSTVPGVTTAISNYHNTPSQPWDVVTCDDLP